MEGHDTNKALKFLGFIAGLYLIALSMYFTFILFESFDTGSFMGLILGIGGICIDIGKPVSVIIMLAALAKGDNARAVLALFFCLGCFSISILASLSVDFNKTNEIRQATMVASDEYQTAKETKQQALNKLAEAKTRTNMPIPEVNSDPKIIEYRNNLEYARSQQWLTTVNTINPPIINGRPRLGVDYWEAEIRKRSVEILGEHANLVTQAEADILKYEFLSSKTDEELLNLKDSSLLATKGMLAIADWVHEQGVGSSGMALLGFFFIAKNIFLEMLGTFLIINSSQPGLLSIKRTTKKPQAPSAHRADSGKVANRELRPTTKPLAKHEPKVRQSHEMPRSPMPQRPPREAKEVTAKTKSEIGFNRQEAKPKTPDDPNIVKYKEAMMKNVENTPEGKKLDGYKKIRDRAGLSEGVAREVYTYLKRNGDIQVKGGNTYLGS